MDFWTHHQIIWNGIIIYTRKNSLREWLVHFRLASWVTTQHGWEPLLLIKKMVESTFFFNRFPIGDQRGRVGGASLRDWIAGADQRGPASRIAARTATATARQHRRSVQETRPGSQSRAHPAQKVLQRSVEPVALPRVFHRLELCSPYLIEYHRCSLGPSCCLASLSVHHGAFSIRSWATWNTKILLWQVGRRAIFVRISVQWNWNSFEFTLYQSNTRKSLLEINMMAQISYSVSIVERQWTKWSGGDTWNDTQPFGTGSHRRTEGQNPRLLPSATQRPRVDAVRVGRRRRRSLHGRHPRQPAAQQPQRVPLRSRLLAARGSADRLRGHTRWSR